MNDLIVVEKLAEWQRLKGLVLDSVSSPITRRVYNMALGRQLYGVKSYDPVILGLAAVVLTACALLAGFVPARSAASIEPMQALRTE
jgi:ABC-type lipoprotein release transport system permease subunit